MHKSMKKNITVGELVEMLQQFPSDMVVKFEEEWCGNYCPLDYSTMIATKRPFENIDKGNQWTEEVCEREGIPDEFLYFTQSKYADEEEILKMVNEYRIRDGLEPLKSLDSLSE